MRRVWWGVKWRIQTGLGTLVFGRTARLSRIDSYEQNSSEIFLGSAPVPAHQPPLIRRCGAFLLHCCVLPKTEDQSPKTPLVSISTWAVNTVRAIGAITVRVGVNAIAIAITVVAVSSAAVITHVGSISICSMTHVSVTPFTVTGVVTVYELAALLPPRRILPPAPSSLSSNIRNDNHQ